MKLRDKSKARDKGQDVMAVVNVIPNKATGVLHFVIGVFRCGVCVRGVEYVGLCVCAFVNVRFVFVSVLPLCSLLSLSLSLSLSLDLSRPLSTSLDLSRPLSTSLDLSLDLCDGTAELGAWLLAAGGKVTVFALSPNSLDVLTRKPKYKHMFHVLFFASRLAIKG